VTIENRIKDLMEFFGQKMTDTRFNFYHALLKQCGPDLIEGACNQAKRSLQRFPTVNELAKFIQEQKNIKWQHHKETEPVKLPEPQDADPRAADDGWRMIHRGLDRTVSRSQLLAEMRMMEVAFPGQGWKAEANGLDAYYQKHGLPVNDKPRRKVVWAEEMKQAEP